MKFGFVVTAFLGVEGFYGVETDEVTFVNALENGREDGVEFLEGFVVELASAVVEHEFGVSAGALDVEDAIDGHELDATVLANREEFGGGDGAGVAFGGALQGGGEALAGKRFRDEIENAVFEGTESLVDVGGDDDGVERTGDGGGEELHAIATVKIEIEQEQIDRRFVEAGAGFGEEGGDADGRDFVGKEFAAKALQALGEQRFVFGDEDPHAVLGARRRRWADGSGVDSCALGGAETNGTVMMVSQPEGDGWLASDHAAVKLSSRRALM